MRAFLSAAVLLLPALAWAQPDDRSQLPSLTPAVFESRGTVAVTLPVVERQPLSGFGPLPRRYVVPAEREPVTLPFVPDLDALPSLALAPPPEPPASSLEIHRLRAEAGAGAYLARYGRLDLSGAGAAGEFFVDADYDGVGETVGRVDFDRVAVEAGGRSVGIARVHITARGLVDAYSTPGVGFGERRLRRGVGAEAGVEGVGATPFALTVGFEQGRLTRTDDSEETSEGRLDASGRLGLFADRVAVDAAAGIAGAGTVGTDVQYGAAGLALTLIDREGLRLAVGARALAYDASAAAGAGDAQTVGPILDLQVPFGTTTVAFATNDPHVGVRSLMDLTEDNRYVAENPLVVPDVVPVDARAGLELRPGALRARVFGRALIAPTYLAFEQFGAAFEPVYLDAQAFGLGADLAVTHASGVSASAGLEIRDGRSDDGEIPFFAPLIGHVGVQVPFPGGRVGLAAHAESARPIDRIDSHEAPAYGRLSLDARYDVWGPLAVVLRGERFLGERQRWPGFPEPPFTVMAGLRLAR